SPKSWKAPDSAVDDWPVAASWPSTWMAWPPHAQADPPASCEPFWVVEAALPDVADEAALFDCVTLPSEPGLQTRTGEASFDGSCCRAVDSAPESCSVSADCLAI